MDAVFQFPEIDYVEKPVSEIKTESFQDPKTGKWKTENLIIDDTRVKPTERFWTSLCSLYGFGPSIFNYFSHKEVFDRVAEVSEKFRLQVAVERGNEPKALAVSTPSKTMLFDDEVTRILGRVDTREVQYANGVVTSRHNLRNPITFQIGKDTFECFFTMETPMDGYGTPTIYVSMLREACKNNLVVKHKAFKSGIILGKNAALDTVIRTVESYSNEDGFLALKDRIASSQKSNASVYECSTLARVFYGLESKSFSPEFKMALPIDEEKNPSGYRNNLLDTLGKISGDLRSIYGLAQLDSLSVKRMRQLPAKCSVYELLNLATEVTTYQLSPDSGYGMQSWVAGTLTTEYDLEGSRDEFGDFEAIMDPRTLSIIQARKNMNSGKSSVGVGEVGKRVLDLTE